MEPEPFVGSPDRDIVPKEITTITNTKSVSFRILLWNFERDFKRFVC